MNNFENFCHVIIRMYIRHINIVLLQNVSSHSKSSISNSCVTHYRNTILNTIHLTLFAASLTGEEPQRLEHADLRWMTWQEAQSHPFCPADQEILARLGQIVPFGKG